MKETLNIVLSGQAGQGLMTLESLLADVIRKEYYLFTSPEFMSRVRGGNNSVELVLSSEPIESWRKIIDILFVLGPESFVRMKPRLGKDTLVISESKFVSSEEQKDINFIELPLTELSKEAGGQIYGNTIIFGYICRLLGLSAESARDSISRKFAKLKDDVIQKNLVAFDMGYDSLAKEASIKNISKVKNKPLTKVMDGSTAVGIGALAGGVNYLASYPMSPSTGVMMYLARKGKEFDVLVEQAEDEIAALNMVIGAWYAGARGLATTSGGGFALMCEALSLSGITETPCVIHLAQRPGPATGLPTRTEQGDLNLALYAGHGEFPRIILSPGNIKDAALLTSKAFRLADKYQVPVIILTDQYLLDSMSETEPFEFDESALESFVVETKSGYLRYDLSKGPISPRGIPGFGKGFVKADSDEHTEEGLITEDFDVRNSMNEKRLAKKALILQDYQDAQLYGPDDYDRLLVGFGSTYGVLKEYVETTDKKDTFLYLKQVYPLPETLKKYFEKAGEVVVVENNATGQLAALLKGELDIKVDHNILKYSGEPFSIEEIEDRIGGLS